MAYANRTGFTFALARVLQLVSCWPVQLICTHHIMYATNTSWCGLSTSPMAPLQTPSSAADDMVNGESMQWLFGGRRDRHTLQQCFSAWFQLSLPLDEPEPLDVPDKYDGCRIDHLIRFGWNQEQG